MTNEKIIVVLDYQEHGRNWHSEFENIEVKRVNHTDNLAIYENKCILYAFHRRDFLSFSSEKKGIFSKEESCWPQNLLWFSGECISDKLPGHVYKFEVPHDLKKNNKFFYAIRRLVSEILTKGFKNNNTKELSNEIWNVLYKQETFLTTLFILCQGYLIGQGKIKLPDNITILKKKKEETKRFKWWEPALTKNNKIDNELEAISKTSKNIPLIDIIRNNKLKGTVCFNNKILIEKIENDFTEKVNEAYNILTKILRGNS